MFKFSLILLLMIPTTLSAQVEPNGKAVKTTKAFKMTYAVSNSIQADAATIWKLLTDAPHYPTWNSTIVSIGGTIADKEKIQLVAKIAPERTFSIKVGDWLPNQSMTWKDGFAPMFRGKRVFSLTPNSDGSVTFFMAETYSGSMLPMIKGSLPDFTASFEQFAADLKRAAEAD